MLVRFLILAALLLAGSGATDADTDSGSVHATAPAASTVPAVAIEPAITAPAADTASVNEHDVVVPAVDPSGAVVVSPDVVAARRDGSAIVADQLVGADRVESAVLPTDTFQTLGVTWPQGTDVADLAAEVRTRSGDTWTGWVPLETSDGGPDVASADVARGARGGTDSVWVGNSNAVQLSFAATSVSGPDGLSLVLVGSSPVPVQTAGASTAPASLESSAGRVSIVAADYRTAPLRTAVSAPRVISRSEWGARDPVCTPGVASTLVGAVVHHTAGSNAYSTVAEAMQQIRNDQNYHIDGRGWCDIGYNFIVDKWGNIYEGRANSSTAPVIGVHAGGFNTGTVGIAMLGDYSTVSPPAATQESVARVIAWRLSAYNRDPSGTFTYTTLGGENSRYAAGTTLTLPVVLAHRDVAYTACPGAAGYSTLGWVRTRARQLVGPSFINPRISAATIARGSAVSVRAGTISNIDWTLTVTDSRTGIVAAQPVGYAQEALGGVVATWDGRGPSSDAVGPGTYRLVLSGTERGTGVVASPWSTAVEVTGSLNPPIVAAVPLGSDLTFVPITPQRIADTRPTSTALGPHSRMDVVVAGIAGVPSDARAVAVNLTAVHASSMTYLRAWPAGEAMPASSVLNTSPSRTVATHVVVGVGGENKVSIYNDSGSVHIAVDISGYYVASGGTRYEPLATPARLLDTRTSGPRLTSGASRTVTVAGSGGVASDATAVVVNVTSVGAASDGYVVAVPHGAADPTASTVNNQRGGDATNRATVQLSGGALDVRLAGGAADVVVDVVGWYGPGATTRFTPIAPIRAFDTRTSSSPMTAGETREFSVRDVVGAPADARAGVVIVTATQQSAWATFMTVWDGGSSRPATSDLNTGARWDQSNLVLASWSPSGYLSVYNNLGTAHLIGDVYGYFR